MQEPKMEEEVWQIVHALNRAWTVDGNADALADYFHESMVAITPTGRERVE